VNQLLATEVRELTRPPRQGHCTGLGCEASLRVAAEMVSNARSGEVTATTVVGILGQDDAATFEALVAEIAAECGLETRIRIHVGSFSVRFSREPYDGSPGRCAL
jgi:hypothetical protein